MNKEVNLTNGDIKSSVTAGKGVSSQNADAKVYTTASTTTKSDGTTSNQIAVGAKASVTVKENATEYEFGAFIELQAQSPSGR